MDTFKISLQKTNDWWPTRVCSTALLTSPSSTPKAPSTQCGWHHYHHLWNHIQTSSHHMHQVLNKYRVIFHQQFSTKQKIYHFATGGVHLPFFETADHQIQFSWKLSPHPNIQVNPDTSPTQTIDAVFLWTILAPRKKTTHTHILKSTIVSSNTPTPSIIF